MRSINKKPSKKRRLEIYKKALILYRYHLENYYVLEPMEGSRDKVNCGFCYYLGRVYGVNYINTVEFFPELLEQFRHILCVEYRTEKSFAFRVRALENAILEIELNSTRRV